MDNFYIYFGQYATEVIVSSLFFFSNFRGGNYHAGVLTVGSCILFKIMIIFHFR